MSEPATRHIGTDTEHRPAGIVTRSAAAGIDLAVLIVICSLAYLGLALARLVWSPTTFSWPDVPFWITVIFGLVVSVVYLTAAWAMTGRSYGDYVMGLRVLTNRHNLLHWSHSFIRAVFCVFFAVGLAWVIVSPARRSLQDVVLRTTVVYDWHIGAE